MSLESEFSDGFEQEHIENFGRQLLKEYGVKACIAASQLDSSDLSPSSLETYKPQIRQIVSATEDTIPDPKDAAQIINNSDKTDKAKRIMLSSIKSYYKTIGEPEYATAVSEYCTFTVNQEQKRSGNVLTSEEINTILGDVLPDKQEAFKEVAGNETYIISLEHKALFITILHTNCVTNELCERHDDDFCLRVSDIDTANNTVDVVMLDRDEEEPQHTTKRVGEVCTETVTEYLDQQNIESGPVFDFRSRTAQNRLNEIQQAYVSLGNTFQNVEKLTPTIVANSEPT